MSINNKSGERKKSSIILIVIIRRLQEHSPQHRIGHKNTTIIWHTTISSANGYKNILLVTRMNIYLAEIGSILNPLVGKFSEDTRKKGKGAKTGASQDFICFYLLQYDWLKGSYMSYLFGFRAKPIIHTANLCHEILPIPFNCLQSKFFHTKWEFNGHTICNLSNYVTIKH